MKKILISPPQGPALIQFRDAWGAQASDRHPRPCDLDGRLQPARVDQGDLGGQRVLPEGLREVPVALVC